MTQTLEAAGAERRRLFDRDFGLWYLARSVSVGGTAASAVALPLLVYRSSSSPALTAAVVGRWPGPPAHCRRGMCSAWAADAASWGAFTRLAGRSRITRANSLLWATEITRRARSARWSRRCCCRGSAGAPGMVSIAGLGVFVLDTGREVPDYS